MANEFIIRNGFQSRGDSQVTGSLDVTGGITGSYTGSFTGDGSGLTGVTADWDGTHVGNAEITGSLTLTNDLIARNLEPTNDIFLNSGKTLYLDGQSIANTGIYHNQFNGKTIIYSGSAQIEMAYDAGTSSPQVAITNANLSLAGNVTASSYTGSFVGDGSGLTGIVSSSYAVTASFIPVGLGGIYGGNGTVPLNTTAYINGDFTFQGLDEDTRLIVKDGNNGSAIHLFSDGPAGQAGVEFRTQTTNTLLHRIQVAGGDTRYISNNRDLVFSTSTSSFSSGIFITASNGNVGIGKSAPNAILDVNGNTIITGSLTATGLTQGAGTNTVAMYDTGSGQFFYTSSAAIGGGGGSDTNFANTNLTFDGNRYHDSNGFDFYVTADSGGFASAYLGYELTSFMGLITTSSFIGVENTYIQTIDQSGAQSIRFVAESTQSMLIYGGAAGGVAINNNSLFVSTVTDNVSVGKNTSNAKLDVNGDTIISGSTTIKNLGSTALNVIGSGSNNILDVNGSVGELLSVTDSNTGALFTVNNSASETMLQVNSDNTITYGIPSKPALQTTTTANVGTSPTVIYNIPTSSYTGAFVEYTITSESNARTGKIDAIWNAGTINFADVTGSGIGTTSGFTFAVILSGSNAVITGSASTTDWTVNAIIRSI